MSAAAEGGFLDESRGFPYCKGCGHPHVLRALDEALAAAELPRERVALVTDIGCVGLADGLFPTTHTVHTLHGRSTAVAAGLCLARGAGTPGDRSAAGQGPCRDLKPVVLIGDGGAGIGLIHLVHAAQMNVDLTVLLHNNLVYGMTGGQSSALTPAGMKTTTAADGCPFPPLDILAILAGAGAGFLARGIAADKSFPGMVADALRHPGFACVEALELCPTFATMRGGITGKDLRALPERLGRPLGQIRRETRPVFPPAEAGAVGDTEELEGIATEPSWGRIDRTVRLVLAGRAGEGVQTAAHLAATAAMAAGLQVTIRSDYPVTQGTGFSLAELSFAPGPIGYTGLVAPDFVLVTAPEGAKELAARGLLSSPKAGGRYVFDETVDPPAGLVAVRRDFRARFGPKSAILGAAVEAIDGSNWLDPRAWDAAIASLSPKRREDAAKVVAAALSRPA